MTPVGLSSAHPLGRELTVFQFRITESDLGGEPWSPGADAGRDGGVSGRSLGAPS